MRLPGMTTRRWMIVIAGVAFLAGGWVEYVRLSQLSAYYHKRRNIFLNNYIHYRRDVSNYCEWCVAAFGKMRVSRSAYMPEERFKDFKREFDVIELQSLIVADHFLGLARKYERAAAHPWWSIPPDPALPVCFETLDAWLEKALYAHYGWDFPPPVPPESRPWWTVPSGPIPPEADDHDNQTHHP